MSLGKDLATARVIAGYTQSEAAKRLFGMDKSMLSKIEHGYCMPMLAQLEFLCMLYDYPQDKALELVAEEYGLTCPKKAEKVVDESKPYKLTLRIPRDVATEFLAIVQRRGKRNMQEWLNGYIADAVRREKKKSAACVAAQTTQNREKHSTHIIRGEMENVKCK